MSPFPKTLAVLTAAVWLTGGLPCPAATRAEPAEFFRRLASIGLDTAYLRELTGKIEIYYRKPSSTAEAQYGYILNNLYVPTEFKEEGSRRLRFDLEASQINTLVHEYMHAAYDVMASEDAPKGSDSYKHWDAVQAIWADLFNDPRHARFGVPRYPRMKADEVASYYLGAAIMNVFMGADEILLYNEKLLRKYIHTPADAERLGDTIVLPDTSDPEDHFSRRIAGSRYWRASVEDSAAFEGGNIGWKEVDWVRLQLFRHGLGLHPPEDAAQLVARLNRIDNVWIRGKRAAIAAARRKRAEELRAEQEGAAGPPGGDTFGDLRER